MIDIYFEMIDEAKNFDELDSVKYDINTEYDICRKTLTSISKEPKAVRSKFNAENKAVVDFVRNYRFYISAIESKNLKLQMDEDGGLEPLNEDEFNNLLLNFSNDF